VAGEAGLQLGVAGPIGRVYSDAVAEEQVAAFPVAGGLADVDVDGEVGRADHPVSGLADS